MTMRRLKFVLICAILFFLACFTWRQATPVVAGPVQPANDTSHPDAGGDVYYVDWHISAHGDLDYFRPPEGRDHIIVHDQLLVQGSSVVRQQGGGMVAYPFNFTVSLQTQYRHTFNQGYCLFTDEERFWITDPAYWSGGPDRFWSSQGSFLPMQADDGSWSMQDPVRSPLWRNGLVAREFPGVRAEELFDCSTKTVSREEVAISTNSYTGASNLFTSALQAPGHVQTLTGDRDGLVFTRHDSWIIDPDYPEYPVVTVTYDVTIRRVPGCAGAAGAGQVCQSTCRERTFPIDAKDPVIKTLEIALESDKESIRPNQPFSYDPPSPATFTIRVTCEGVPVKNADVYLEVEAEKYSGGHQHDDSGHPRPRGYLKAPGATTYTQLTEEKPGIFLHTDASGLVKLPFLPGRDTLTGGYECRLQGQ